jgi:hypothetical protein
VKSTLALRLVVSASAFAVLSMFLSPVASALQPQSKTVILIAIEVAPGIKVVPGGKVPGSERLSKKLQNQLTVAEKINVPGNFWTISVKPGLSIARTKSVCKQLIASKKIRKCEQMGTFG